VSDEFQSPHDGKEEEQRHPPFKKLREEVKKRLEAKQLPSSREEQILEDEGCLPKPIPPKLLKHIRRKVEDEIRGESEGPQ
jgi:hypothetical protein